VRGGVGVGVRVGVRVGVGVRVSVRVGVRVSVRVGVRVRARARARVRVGVRTGVSARVRVRARPPRVPRYAALQMRPGGGKQRKRCGVHYARGGYAHPVRAVRGGKLRGQAALRLRYVPYAGGRSTWGYNHRTQGTGPRSLYVSHGGPGGYVSA